MLSTVYNGFGIPLNEDVAMNEDKQSFLPERLVMLDAEFTGVGSPIDEDILQIAALKIVLKDNQYVVEGEPFEVFLHTNKEPNNEFHIKYLSDIYKKAQESELVDSDAAEMFEAWLGSWAYSKVPACGDAVNNDMDFLYSHNIIKRGTYEGDTEVPGTLHYGLFDIDPIQKVGRQKLGRKPTDEELDLDPGIHNALVDCHNQLKELNYYLEVFLK